MLYIQINCLEEAFKQQSHKFANDWKEKSQLFQENTQKIEDELTFKHNNKINSLNKNLEENISDKIIYSKKYYDLRDQQEKLVKFHKYNFYFKQDLEKLM